MGTSAKVDHWATRYVSGSKQQSDASQKGSLTDPASALQRTRTVSQDYSAPVIQGSDGGLSKVCGSLIDPVDSRNKWACAGCNSIFARDSTLYAAPPSQQHKDAAYYCKICYAQRYSPGKCMSCSRDILGSTQEEGKYVKAAAGLWHGKCWKCTRCNKSDKDGVQIISGMDGQPCCEDCFGKPAKTRSSPSPEHDAGGQREEVRRVTRVAGAGSGPMGATMAELSTRLGKTSIAPVSRPRSPTKATTVSTTNVAVSPTKPCLNRTGSLTGSPPKPRPLTAQFNGGLNLAAFQPSFPPSQDRNTERLSRKDSRSRSVSPVKHIPTTSVQQEQTVLEPSLGTARCQVCHLLPFELSTAVGTQEVLMVTIPGDVTLHAECFRCDICRKTIDGTKPFVRLEAKNTFAHPQCSPPFSRMSVETVQKNERSFRTAAESQGASPRNHATHQRELRPSAIPTPSASPPKQQHFTATTSTVVRRFQPTAGAAPPTHSTIMISRPAGPANPAAGIFSRLNALSAASNVDLTTGGAQRKYGGMQKCALCGLPVSALESVLGPRNTQWHKACLVCQAPSTAPPNWRTGKVRLCGKKLDSGAKVNAQGDVRCRDCYDHEASAFRIRS